MSNNREMVQSLAFGLSFLQRMDMKPVVVMGWSMDEEVSPVGSNPVSDCSRGLVERSQQLTEALQQHSASVLPFFSAESFLLLHEAGRGSRSVVRKQPLLVPASEQCKRLTFELTDVVRCRCCIFSVFFFVLFLISSRPTVCRSTLRWTPASSSGVWTAGPSLWSVRWAETTRAALCC